MLLYYTMLLYKANALYYELTKGSSSFLNFLEKDFYLYKKTCDLWYERLYDISKQRCR